MKLERIDGRYAVCRLDAGADVPVWVDLNAPLVSVTRTDRELSIVAPQAHVPADVDAERGWVALRVAGTLDFSIVGVLSQLTSALADAGVPVFALSTYETDYLFVKEEHADAAARALA